MLEFVHSSAVQLVILLLRDTALLYPSQSEHGIRVS